MRGHREVRRRRATAVVSIALLVAACSSGSDGEPAITLTTTTAVANSTTTTSTTLLPTTTSLVVTTTSVAGSTTTGSPSTSVAETTTVAPSVDPEADVRTALDRSFADFSECLTSMPNCDPSVLEATRSGELLEGNVARINEWNAAGYTVVDRESYRYVIEMVDVGADGSSASALVCLADGSKLVEPGAEENGGDVIIDAEFVSGRSSWLLQRGGDGSWRAFAAPAVGESAGSDICPAS